MLRVLHTFPSFCPRKRSIAAPVGARIHGRLLGEKPAFRKSFRLVWYHEPAKMRKNIEADLIGTVPGIGATRETGIAKLGGRGGERMGLGESAQLHNYPPR